jgi:glycosyltransferase involved in cell wall biosynthesis
VSRQTARDIGTCFHVPAQRITIVPNGLDHGQFRPGSRELARAAVAAPRQVTAAFFLYVARLEHPAKNHVRLIAAFNGFKSSTGSPWQLVLAGSDWHGADAVHAAVRQSPFARDIRCLGFVPATELPEWYRAADVFLFPSCFEGFGLPPLEAMACGCPVLSSVRGALAETVGHAAGRLEPDDVAQIQSQLARAALEGAWRDQLAAAGLARARDFDWQTSAHATLAVYQRALVQTASATAPVSRPRRPTPDATIPSRP